MNDPILERFRARGALEREAQEADVNRRRERSAQERKRVLDLMPGALDRMFDRLERLDYRGGAVAGAIHSLTLTSGETIDVVAWLVGSPDDKVPHGQRRDGGIYITSRRLFARSIRSFPARSDELAQLELESVSIVELRRVMEGIEKVGALRSA